MKHAAMNKFFRIVWNAVSQCWQAVSEIARGKCKSSRSKSGRYNANNIATVFISSLLIIPTAIAGPAGGSVTAGQGIIKQSGANTTITQQSAKLAIDWNTFSINSQESVNFIQPTTSSIALNRVTGAESSSILGSLTANGLVWILNPNGVLFGNSAQVNVGGLIASTLNLSNQDFLAGKYIFTGTGTGTVENQGTIKVPVGGTVAFMAPVVRNNGSIIATQGNVLLAAAEAVTIKPVDSSLAYTIDKGAVDALVENGGLIQADGGRVVLTAAAQDSLAKSVINNTGIIEANTVQNHNGTILLLGDKQTGTVNVAGTLSAAAPKGGDGGFIETSAANVKVADGAIISTNAPQGITGQWLIDPTDFTIAASGGDITGGSIFYGLKNNNLVIDSRNGTKEGSGNIYVNDTIYWGGNKLTLRAQNDININSTMNGSGAAQLALEYGQGAVASGNKSDYYVNAPVTLPSGNNFSTKLGSDGVTVQFTVITDLGAPGSTSATDLQGMQGNLAGHYVLGSDIDASATAGGAWSSAGFVPVGIAYNYSGTPTYFSGNFDGLGHTISGLTINRPTKDNVGLFGFSYGDIRNIGTINDNISGHDYVGGLVGANNGKLFNSYTTGIVSGYNFTGGLVGSNSGTLTNIYATAIVSGYSSPGGLVGYNGGTLTNSYATGNVSGTYSTGGLVGRNDGTFTNSFYDVDQGTINGTHMLGKGGIYHNQFQDWLTHGRALDITQYTSLPLAADGYYSVNNIEGLKDMLGFTTKGYKFRLNSDINLSTTPGFYIPTFIGTFDGGSHVISNLAVTAPGNDNIGFFGQSSGTITNVGVVNANVSGQNFVGGLVGQNNSGTLTNSYATGSVSGTYYTGGLVGYNNGTLTNNYATGNVSGTYHTGGLVGYNGSGTLSSSYATGNVSGSDYTGGLVGFNRGSLTNTYALGSVSGSNIVGGLVGTNVGSVNNSYSTGLVSSSNNNKGGLIGTNTNFEGYATGYNSYACGFSTCYYSFSYPYYSYGSVNNSFWDVITSGLASSAGGIGLTTAQMQTASNFTGFNFTTTPGAADNNWVMVDNDGTLNNAGGALGGTFPMLASEYSTTINNAHQLQLMAVNLSGNYNLNRNINAAATGTTGDIWSGSTFIPVGHDSAGFPRTYNFIGSFDGLGHTIDNLTVNQPDSWFVGLFGATGAGSNIRNVGIINGNFSGKYYVGGLTGGNLFGGSISNSYSSSNVTGTDYVGGLSGYDYNGIIKESYASGTVVGNGFDAGGLVGLNEGVSGVITNSYSTSNVKGINNVGGFLGRQIGGTVINSYSTGAVNGNDNSGGLVGYNSGNISSSFSNSQVTGTGNSMGGLVGFNEGTISNAFATGGVSSSGNVSRYSYTGGLVGINYGTLTNSYATGNVSGIANTGGLVAFSNGNLTNSFYDVDQVTINGSHQLMVGGIYHNQFQDWLTHGRALDITQYTSFPIASDGYYNVSNVQGLKDMLGFYAGYKFRLTSDIDLSTAPGLYIPYFSGTFDGGDHVISNLAVTTPGNDNIGLFGQLSGTVTDVSVINANLSGKDYVGGIVGYNGGTLINSYSSGSMSGIYNTGGLVGYNYGTLTNSYATGNVIGYSYTGGLVGINDGTLTNSYATGSVSSTSIYTGGIVGYNRSGTITNTYATGNVSGNDYAGGLVGYNSGTVNSSFWDTQTTGQGTSAGGTGLTTAQMQQQSNFSGFDFSKTWIIYNGHTDPLLRSFMTPLTVNANSVSKTYDGLAYSGSNSVTYSSTPNSNLLGTVNYSGPPSGATNAGSYAITLGGLYSSQQGYSISFVDGALKIDPRSVNLTGSRIYDGTTAVASSIFMLGNLVSGETLTLSGTGSVASKNVAAGTQTVTLGTLALVSGSGLASNYTFTGGTQTANFSPVAISPYVGAYNKIYDGNTTAAVSVNALSNSFGGDTIYLSIANSDFDTKIVGSAKTVTFSGLGIAGAGAGNYTLTTNSFSNIADITAKALSIANLTAANKTYDGNTIATITGNSLTGVISGDTVSSTITGASFDTKNVGIAKTVTANGIGLTGLDSGNYSVATAAKTQSDITAKALTLANLKADNKVYDGNTNATVGLTGFTGVISGDTVVAALGSASFADKNAATGKTVTVNGNALTGTDAGNYSVASSAKTQADITPKLLTLASVTANNKVYDGNTTATISAKNITDIIANDVVGATVSSSNFNTKNVGTGKTVTVNGIALSGADAGNYSLNTTTATTLADITAKALTLASLTAANKIYDGNSSATITGSSLSGVITGDTVNTAITSATFNTKNVGTGKAVTASGIGLSGSDVGNYTLSTSTASTQADITAKELTLASLTAANKVYDSNTSATITGNSLTGIIGTDNVGSNITSASFDTKNAGTAKTVTVSSALLTGADSANYKIGFTNATTQANITPKALMLASVTASSKIYDGNTTANIIAKNITGIITNDVVGETISSANFDTKNMGTGKTVTVNGIALSGTDAGNYMLNTTTATTLANITPKALSITGFASANKVYDRTTLATTSNKGTLSGVVSGDTVSFTNGLATFSDRNAGLNKTVILNGVVLGGLDAANYTYSGGGNDLSDITSKSVSVSGFSVYDKKYDGTILAVIKNAGTLSGIISGDFASFYYSNATFANALAGKNKTVTLNGIGLNGIDALNYIYTGPTTTKATITP